LTPTAPRLELLSRPGWDEQTPNLLRAVAHHPHLLEPFLGFAAALAARGTLPRRTSELLALRAAWNCRSDFEWGHHARYALAAGCSEAEIDAVAAGPAAASWSEADRALLAAADELHARHAIADETWAALAAQWSPAQLVEIPFVVGQYTMLSMVAGALRVPLEEGLPRLPRDPDTDAAVGRS
jgi:alkylhydroperoxidase family enzyme